MDTKELMFGIWNIILSIAVEVLFGYLAITAQGPIALLALAIVGFNTVTIILFWSCIYEEWEKEES